MASQLLLFEQNEPAPRDSRTLPVFDLPSYKNKTYLTHNFHPYPAKFVPQIPRLLIETFSKRGDVVLDPFCGSGTTLVEARLLGRVGVGSDTHPVAVLVSKAKVLALSDVQFGKLADFQQEILAHYTVRRDTGKLPQDDPIPEFINRDKWFTDVALLELNFLRSKIFKCDDNALRDLLLTCFSSIIVKVSNQESETRWRSVERNVAIGEVLQTFLIHLTAMVERAKSFSELTSDSPMPYIQRASAEELTFLSNSEVDLIVTSPPYMNSFDYYLYHKLRLYWLGYDHREVQTAEIGSRNKFSDLGHTEEMFNSAMVKCLQEMRRVTKPSARVVLVVGDSILRGQFIDMGTQYTDLLQRTGFSVLDKFSYDQRKYSKTFNQKWQSHHKQSHIILTTKST